MTEVEAQELIAEIKDSNSSRIIATSNIPGCQEGYMAAMENIEKIINRFANKPPKGGICVIESLDGCKQCSEDYVQVYYQAMVKYSDE